MYPGDPRYSEFHANAQRGAFFDLAGQADLENADGRRLFNTLVASIPLFAIVLVEVVLAFLVAR
jgi:hypothetical protein